MSSQKAGSETGTRHTLTRGQVATRLGISTSSVRRLEWDLLHPVQDDRGNWRFDPAELDGLPARRTRGDEGRSAAADEARTNARKGRLAARVFCMFARDISLPQIVVATKQPPEVVRALYHEWVTSLHDHEWDASRAARR